MDRSRVRNSAIGTASQAPLIPRNCGRISREIVVNTRVLAKEMIADTLPFDNAVKNPEERILNPQNRKFMANSRKPVTASS